MPLWNCLRERFREVWSDTSSDVGALIGCSGGADSVALTRLIVERYRMRHAEADRGAPPLCIAHFNHRLRGKQSDADEAFVRELATRLGVTLYVGQAGSDGSCDAEAGLRQDRLDFFARTAAETGCRYVVLAHTCDDQAETVLHHLLRGTGAAGLRGIQPARPLGSDFVIRRPLLTFRREELRAGLQEIGQTWREDASNQDTRYTRNWIRHEALPTLRLRFPHAVDAISRAAENQWQTDDLIGRMARQWIDAFVATDSEVDRRGQNSGSVELIQFARPSVMSWSTTKTSLERWPHSDSLAQEIPIVVAACQKVFAERDWPRRDMSREHWMRLANAIVSADNEAGASEQDGQTPRADIAVGPIDRREVSLGHWPGHIEGIRTAQFVTLRWTRKRDDNT
ncbi:MAG: tRNA lysidine(34) synthetase TilS [Rhodopirellula sp. JB044]|uniref:tRNA lysidine(34) synthetase TilS n=1 Tax=Rhodopirellula sp. JB044 TaxID=3342844 RepID=UPI00370B8650